MHTSLAAVVAQPPEFDVFPTSPHLVLHNDRMILHVEITSGTDRIAIRWQHAGKNYTEFIHENPLCTEGVSAVCSHFHTNKLDAAGVGVSRGFRTLIPPVHDLGYHITSDLNPHACVQYPQVLYR